MSDILTFIQTATPTGIIALLCLIILYMIAGQKKMKKLFQSMEPGNSEVPFQLIDKKLDKIMGNHLHELPEMKKLLDNLTNKVDDVAKEQVVQGNRLTRVETIISK